MVPVTTNQLCHIGPISPDISRQMINPNPKMAQIDASL